MPIIYQKTHFIKSAMKLSQLPKDEGVEVAFVGRSNAGKSSALNCITGVFGLAKTSKTPGRTQCINIFEVENNKRLIDLPGYGFAKVPVKTKSAWESLLDQYFHSRKSLTGLCMIMDIRHPLQQLDNAMIHWATENNLLVHILLTKADKFSRGKSLQILQEIKKALPLETISCQLFSSTKKQGLQEARAKISRWLLTEKEQ